MHAFFVRILRPDGKLDPWTFAGIVVGGPLLEEIQRQVEEDNGEDTFFSVKLPD
jgi:hypothetical protein